MKTKRALLVAAACLSLSVPALAQNSNTTSSKPNESQTQNQPNDMQSQGQNQSDKMQNQSGKMQNQQAQNQQQAKTIEPSSLSKEQVREVQMNLNKAGFDAKKVDGLWGPETEQALKQFQQTKKLPGDGELNQQTAEALGVSLNNESQTVGSSNQSAKDSMQEQGQMQKNSQEGSMNNGNSTGKMDKGSLSNNKQ